MKRFYFLVGLTFLLSYQKSFCQVALTAPGGSYSQDFNSLAGTGTSSTLPAGWLLYESGTNSNGLYTAGTGSSNSGDAYSFGASGSTDRAFGGLLSGSLTPTIGLAFTNNTGSTISSITISYTGEEWRLGTLNRLDRLDFQYSIDASSLNTGTWTDVNELDFTTPVSTGSTGALDGNAPANRTALSFTITGLSIPNGGSFFIRWNDFNASGADDGLGVDDFLMEWANVDGSSKTVDVLPGSNAAEPSTDGTFQITLSSPAPAGGVTIQYSLGGTATLNSDYTDPQAGSLTITEGNNSGFITLPIINDAVVEASKTISLTLTAASNGFSVGTSSASIELADDDTPPYISLGGTYSQNFNSLASSGSSLPWTDNVTIRGWYSSRTIYNAGTGSSNGGALYSFGNSGSEERALGSLASGSTSTVYYGARFVNNTGTTITALKISYTGEQWRNSGNTSAQSLVFAYQTSTTAIASLIDGTWTTVSDLNFTSPVTGGSASAIDGNAAENSAFVSFTIRGLDIAPGDELFIRWADDDNSGSDHGLAIDDVLVEANPVDHDAPLVNTLLPANGATEVPTNVDASVVFNEPVQKGSGNIILRRISDNSIIQTIDVNSALVTVSGTNFSIHLSGLSVHTGYSIEMTGGAIQDLAGNDFAGFPAGREWSFTTGTIFYVAAFNNCSSSLTDGFTQFSVAGDASWACTPFGRSAADPSASSPNGVQINGFAGGTNVPNLDWLISPSFDLTGTTYPLLSFWSRIAFNGLPLQLKVSTDYVSGDPRSATWTDINGKFSLQTSDWSLSSDINLSAFKAPNVHFAFVYTSTNEDGARWTLDDISLANSPTPPPPSLTTATTDIQFNFVAAGANAVKTFDFTGNDLTSGVTLTATGSFELSKDGSMFSSSLSYSVEEANNVNKTVYVRFAPAQKNEDYSGSISITTGDLLNQVSLKGTSIDPATTLEVVNWNIEWFGSTDPSLGPTNDDLQEQNVRTVLQNAGADIYGLVEVVDESRLANMVRQMPGYTYVIGNYGSHVNPPDADGGPLSEAQKLAFVYKTSMFSNVTVRPLINNQDIHSDSYSYWSSGRYPLLMTADVTLNCVTKKINFILVHAKANTSPTRTSYARREAAAKELHDTIQTYFADENVIVLGDFNDDLDQTITSGITPPVTSYSSFTTDTENFFSPTLALSLAGKKSTVSYNDMIDHVMLSNEMEAYYMPSTATVLSDVSSLVSNYRSTTTDHYPVFTRYKFEAPAPPAITSCPTVPAFCASADGNYTIPAFTATSVCGSVNYSYVITGTTERSGTTNDASGHFKTGTSFISWTATDAAGNSVSCQTTVVVNANPVVTIPDAYALNSGVLANTVYIGYQPASSITLSSVVSSGSPDYTYSWSTGAQTASTVVSPGVNTSYTLTVTDAHGCTGATSKTVTVIDIRAGKKLDKVSVCHTAGNDHSIEVSASAVPAHLSHGDMLGSCEAIAPVLVNQFERLHQSLELEARVLPNPSPNGFTLVISGGNPAEKITILVTDATGRRVEVNNTISTNKTITIGENYRPGVYFAEVIQGAARKQIKLVKLGH